MHYMAVAADLAAAMIQELASLQPDDGPLAVSLRAQGTSVKEQLASLVGIMERITIARGAEDAVELIARAKMLLLRLGNDLEQLSSAAECHCEPSPARWDRFDMTSMPFPLRSH
jgi:hypothetical protein